ncbi:MAG TPA: FHA domain-containing serine/threonine-protein kinase [Ktedonobacteraceae bacterium]|nr:FHA domain-containing serine/threonine-protein kinase [Ktedonobacteraceae bacterium]
MAALELNQSFERYRIIQWLGNGISGESYEAEDTILRRKVTLKLIHPTSTLPDAARRQFFREMQGVSILHHSYLAQVLDYGEFDGKLYIARRFVENGSLLSQNGRLWFKAPLKAIDAVHYGLQLAQVLQYIHNRGLIHGSLTLTNILVLHNSVSENSDITSPFLLADVGLTHFVRSSSEKKDAPLPFTAAPEQHYNRTIPASDQFSLAALLYYWLTGRPPFIGSPQEIEQLKFAQTINPLSTVNPDISLEQDGIIVRALSVSPEDRYPSIQTFADVLLSSFSPNPQPAFSPETTNHSSLHENNTSEQIPQTPVKPEIEANPHSASQINTIPTSVDTSTLTAHLIIFSPYFDEPYIVELLGSEITMGRAGSSDILLDKDDLTSRHHALLKREGEHYLIFDRRSANGIQINGLPIQSDKGYPLIDGDHIKIGNYEMTFRVVVQTSIDPDHRSFASKP